MRHSAPSRTADTARVPTRITAPRSAASRALRTTSRASSTQQSEYSNPVVKTPGLSGAPAASLARSSARVPGKRLPAAQVIVQKQAQRAASRPAASPAVRQHETHGPHDVRSDAPEHLALDRGFAHQAEIEMLQIAQAAVDQLGRARGGAAGEIGHLAQEHRKAASCGIARNAATVDAAADDRQIVHAMHGPPRLTQFARSGISIWKVVPRSVSSRRMLPPCAVTSSCATARPSPVPPARAEP